jgi:hypothetical protein
LPPINLSKELSLTSELLNITLTWQPPLGLVINDNLEYVVSINITSQNLIMTEEYELEVITSNLRYTHDIAFVEQENYLELCMQDDLEISYDTTVVGISVSSTNKVGSGPEVYKEILLDSLCANVEYTTSTG